MAGRLEIPQEERRAQRDVLENTARRECCPGGRRALSEYWTCTSWREPLARWRNSLKIEQDFRILKESIKKYLKSFSEEMGQNILCLVNLGGGGGEYRYVCPCAFLRVKSVCVYLRSYRRTSVP